MMPPLRDDPEALRAYHREYYHRNKHKRTDEERARAAAASTKWYWANRQKALEKHKEYRSRPEVKAAIAAHAQKPEIKAERNRRAKERHRRQAQKNYIKAWQAENKDRINARRRERRTAAESARYRADRLRRTPAWVNKKKMDRVYLLAAWASKFTDEPLHVDHIVPLRGRRVSGLHVESNLQILPASVNEAKGNKWPIRH